jgi:hypothetical protein
LRVDHEIFIAPASDFARTKYTPSQRPLHHFCCERARAQHYDSLTQWTLCARLLAHQMQLLRKYTLLHAGAATRRYTPEKLLLSSLLLLAGAINHFFMVYPQKYKNCSTLTSNKLINELPLAKFLSCRRWPNYLAGHDVSGLECFKSQENDSVTSAKFCILVRGGQGALLPKFEMRFDLA